MSGSKTTEDAFREQIARAVLAWPGVTAEPHQFGGVEFRFGGSEMGHLHGDRLADLPLPKRVRDELIAAGRARPHHVIPESGWVSVWIRSDEDVQAVVGLFRMQYDRLAARREQAKRRQGQERGENAGQA